MLNWGSSYSGRSSLYRNRLRLRTGRREADNDDSAAARSNSSSSVSVTELENGVLRISTRKTDHVQDRQDEGAEEDKLDDKDDRGGRQILGYNQYDILLKSFFL